MKATAAPVPWRWVRFENGRVVYEPVNACILLMGQIDGKELVTVDDLAKNGKLHPVQKAFVDNHASQCGFLYARLRDVAVYALSCGQETNAAGNC